MALRYALHRHRGRRISERDLSATAGGRGRRSAVAAACASNGGLKHFRLAALSLIAFGLWGDPALAEQKPFDDTFASQGQSCGTPGPPMDMSRIYDAVKQYPNGRLLFLTSAEKTRLMEQLRTQTRTPGGPIWELAPCFNCTPEREACILYSARRWGPVDDRFSSDGKPKPPVDPGDDVFSSDCKKNPQSYTCLYGHRDRPPSDGPGRRPGGSKAPPPNETTCHDPPKIDTRFHVGNINDADPALLVTAKILEGWDDCEKEKLSRSLLMLPATYLLQKLRYLQSIMMIYGYGSTAQALIEDIKGLQEPGQTLGQSAYRLGRLLCEGYDLKDILAKRPGKPKDEPPRSTPKVLNNGITVVDDLLLRHFVAAHRIILVLRDSNVFAARWMGLSNAVPKPMTLKAKALKPPEEPGSLTPIQRQDERAYEPYYGLASARGLSAQQRQEITNAGFTIQPKCNGEVITTRKGDYIYSDVDVHGIYGADGAWAGSNPALKSLNGTTTQRFFQHGAQDDYFSRNNPRSPSFGPQPPVTVYTPEGTVQLSTMAEMRDFYIKNGIDWHALYPLPLEQYRAISGKP
jgi:hypothetical protein